MMGESATIMILRPIYPFTFLAPFFVSKKRGQECELKIDSRT